MRAPPYSSQPDELFSAASIENPHPLFARLRRERPVSRVADTGFHLVASWDLVEAALGREADFSANLTGVLLRGEDGRPTAFEMPDNALTRVIATADEPRHAVHRALLQPGLAARVVAGLEDELRAWARDAVAAWLAAGAGDFVPVAELIPARAVARILGLPDGDVRRHRQWAMMGGDMLAGDLDHPQMLRLARENLGMAEYLALQLEKARPSPRAGPEAPLLHALARGVNDGAIEVQEAIGIAIVLFGAGGESTAALIGSAARRLAEDPATADTLRQSPERVGHFVEEVVRLEPPFKFHYRVARRDCELGRVELAAGERLMLLWASANRDATHFEQPDALRLDRKHPKHHLGFGRGGHFCIGAPLARLEARVVCEELLARTEHLALSEQAPPAYTRSIFVRRHERLPLVVRPATPAGSG